MRSIHSFRLKKEKECRKKKKKHIPFMKHDISTNTEKMWRNKFEAIEIIGVNNCYRSPFVVLYIHSILKCIRWKYRFYDSLVLFSLIAYLNVSNWMGINDFSAFFLTKATSWKSNQSNFRIWSRKLHSKHWESLLKRTTYLILFPVYSQQFSCHCISRKPPKHT